MQARVAERGEKIIIKKILSVDYFREWENLRFLSICGEWSICGFFVWMIDRKKIQTPPFSPRVALHSRLHESSGGEDMDKMGRIKREFMGYYCEFFDDDSEIFWFDKFKKIAKTIYRLTNVDDTDYLPLKEICSPSTRDLYRVAEICYEHDVTYFRMEVMLWMELAQGDTESQNVFKRHYLRSFKEYS